MDVQDPFFNFPLSVKIKNKYVRLRGRTYIQTCRSYVHTPRDLTNRASLARRYVGAP